MRSPLLLLAAALAIGCATPSTPRESFQGPGGLFSSLDAAAVDALVYAHRRAHATGRDHLIHAGVLRAVDGGFTYDGLEVASERTQRVSLALTADTVAHFLTYPRSGDRTEDRLHEQLSASDRDNVDRRDPLHRPAYVLTPSMAVRVYRGEARGMEHVTQLRGWHPRTVSARAP